METITYKLEHFEGPLDLLLHLIEKNKVDIYDIPIVEITAQYLEYVRNMEREDLNLVSEFHCYGSHTVRLLKQKCSFQKRWMKKEKKWIPVQSW